MKRTITLAAVGVLGAVSITTALAATERASADRGSGNEDNAVVQSSDAVARGGDGADAVARGGDTVVRGEDGEDGVARGKDGVARGGDGGDGGDAIARGSDAVARGGDGGDGGDAVARGGGEGGDAAVEDGQVLIKMQGAEGVAFSGTCTVGGEEETIEGQAPQEFTFELGEGKLECEIRKEGEGTLKMVLLSGNDRVVQKINGDSTLRLTYSGNGVSSSTTSGSGSSNVVTQSSSGSPGSVTQSSSSSTNR